MAQARDYILPRSGEKTHTGVVVLSVLIFHPSVAPFVQQAARALYEADLLEHFYTTLYDDPKNVLQRLACRVTGAAGYDLAAQLRRRAITEVPQKMVTGFGGREILRLLSGRFDSSGRLTDRVWQWSEMSFDRKVCGKICRGTRGVYGYENSSLRTFERARDLGLRVFYDLPAPESQFCLNILGGELDKFPELHTPYQKHVDAREAERIARRQAEWATADMVVVNSEFTRRSFVESGFPKKEIVVIPYGAPPPVESLPVKSSGTDSPLRLLWAGTFSIRKGAHYLLEAWRKADFGKHATLRIHGAVTLPDKLLNPLPQGVEIAGSIPRMELLRAYQEADALIFPTLCDGFGMVVTEAFSCGLPVITTMAAGAADLIRNRENGLLLEPGNAEAICDALAWCLDNRAALAAMREPALQTARNWQWADYRGKLAAQIKRSLS